MGHEFYTCPCCGYQTFNEPPGSFEICSICFWENDPVQLLDPTYKGGANTLSLIECQENYAQYGACEKRHRNNVRLPLEKETRDPNWRSVIESDLKHIRTPKDLSEDEYNRLDTWYYWIKKRTD